MDDISKAIETLYNLRIDNQNHLRLASQRRKLMFADLNDGNTPEDNPRYDFLRASSGSVLRLLVKLGEDFQNKNPGEVCLLDDLRDVLTRVNLMILQGSASSRNVQKVEEPSTLKQ